MRATIDTVLPLDALALSATVLLPALLFAGGLGFYSDDWRFLSILARAPDQSPTGLIQALAPELPARPPQLLAIALQYRWFGLDPLGYHLALPLVIAVGVVCLHLTLVELGIGRALAFGVAATYGALPHYSTDRFWMSSVPAVLAMAFFFAGSYAILRAGRQTRWTAFWLGGGLGLLGLAGLSYEVFLPPVALLVPVCLVVQGRRRGKWSGSGTLSTWLPIGSVLAVVFGVVMFKVATSGRIPEFPSLLARVRWFALVLRDGLTLDFGAYGVGLPVAAAIAVVRRPDAIRGACALCIGVMAGGYTSVLAQRETQGIAASRQARVLALSGPVVAVVGLAIFTTNYAFLATPSGIANRTAIAAALGTALTLVAGAAWGLQRLNSPAVRTTLFATWVGVVCACGTLLNISLENFWISAARAQAVVVSAIETGVGQLPAGSTLLLDGVCRYVGPGVVFEAPWDLAGRLHIATGQHDLRADVVTPHLRIADDGVTTEIYGADTFYSYTNLFVFDARDASLEKIDNAGALRAFLARADPDQGATCRGEPAAGESVL